MNPFDKMSIVHIVPSIDAEASGPSYSVPRLCESLGALGCNVTLLTLGSKFAAGASNYSHRYYPISKVFGRFFASNQLKTALLSHAQYVDIIHSHSLWLMPNVYPSLAARRAGKPLVLSPRGTLSPVALSRSRWMKKLFWTLVQGPAVRSAACLHATSEQEYRDIRNAGLRQPVAIVPNGVDIPPWIGRKAQSGSRTLLYLGRIHPIKGIDNLLRAWQSIAGRFPDWRLRLVGPDAASHRMQLDRLAAELKLERVEFTGPRYGADKHAEYAAADLFVLPSYSENFGMSVAEALAHGVPVITTTGTPWMSVRERACGWYVSPDTPGLEGALREALTLDRPELDRMGRAGRVWMEREFSWDQIAHEFEKIYKWILQGGPPPASVRLD